MEAREKASTWGTRRNKPTFQRPLELSVHFLLLLLPWRCPGSSRPAGHSGGYNWSMSLCLPMPLPLIPECPRQASLSPTPHLNQNQKPQPRKMRGPSAKRGWRPFRECQPSGGVNVPDTALKCQVVSNGCTVSAAAPTASSSSSPLATGMPTAMVAFAPFCSAPMPNRRTAHCAACGLARFPYVPAQTWERQC